MSDRWLLVAGFATMGTLLLLGFYQTYLLSQMLTHIAELIVKTH